MTTTAKKTTDTRTNATTQDTAPEAPETHGPNGHVVNGRAMEAVRGSGAFLRDNAIPLGLVAAGAGMLAMRTVNGGDNRAAHAVDAAKGKAAETAATVKDGTAERARQAGQKAREGGGAVRQGVGNGVARSRATVETHPVATGLVAAAIGAGVAAAVRHRRG